MLPPMFPRPTKPILVVVAVLVAMSRPPFDGRDVLVAELQLCCGDDRVDLVGRRKPTMAPSTAGLRSVQATATAPAVVP